MDGRVGVLLSHHQPPDDEKPTTNPNPHTTAHAPIPSTLVHCPFGRGGGPGRTGRTGRLASLRDLHASLSQPAIFFDGCSERRSPRESSGPVDKADKKPLQAAHASGVQLAWSRPRPADGQWFPGHQSLLRPAPWQFLSHVPTSQRGGCCWAESHCFPAHGSRSPCRPVPSPSSVEKIACCPGVLYFRARQIFRDGWLFAYHLSRTLPGGEASVPWTADQMDRPHYNR